MNHIAIGVGLGLGLRFGEGAGGGRGAGAVADGVDSNDGSDGQKQNKREHKEAEGADRHVLDVVGHCCYSECHLFLGNSREEPGSSMRSWGGGNTLVNEVT